MGGPYEVPEGETVELECKTDIAVKELQGSFHLEKKINSQFNTIFSVDNRDGTLTPLVVNKIRAMAHHYILSFIFNATVADSGTYRCVYMSRLEPVLWIKSNTTELIVNKGK